MRTMIIATPCSAVSHTILVETDSFSPLALLTRGSHSTVLFTRGCFHRFSPISTAPPALFVRFLALPCSQIPPPQHCLHMHVRKCELSEALLTFGSYASMLANTTTTDSLHSALLACTSYSTMLANTTTTDSLPTALLAFTSFSTMLANTTTTDSLPTALLTYTSYSTMLANATTTTLLTCTSSSTMRANITTTALLAKSFHLVVYTAPSPRLPPQPDFTAIVVVGPQHPVHAPRWGHGVVCPAGISRIARSLCHHPLHRAGGARASMPGPRD